MNRLPIPVLAYLMCFVLTGCLTYDPSVEAPRRLSEAPDFEAFPVVRVYDKPPVPVNLVSHPRAMRFKDRLIEAAKAGPNFAGHYTVVRWSCGDECQQIALIDARTGGVIFAPFVTNLGVRFQTDSRLLIANPPEEIVRVRRLRRPKEGTYRAIYYVWYQERFIEVFSTGSQERYR